MLWNKQAGTRHLRLPHNCCQDKGPRSASTPLEEDGTSAFFFCECMSPEFKGSQFRQMAQVRLKGFLKCRDIQKAQENMRVSELQRV